MCFDRLLDIYRRPSSLLRHHRQRKQLLLPFSRPVSIRVKKNVTKKKIKTKSKQSERERKNQRLPSIKRVRPSPSTDSAAAAATATAAAKFLKMMITHDEPDTRRDKVDNLQTEKDEGISINAHGKRGKEGEQVSMNIRAKKRYLMVDNTQDASSGWVPLRNDLTSTQRNPPSPLSPPPKT